MIKREADLANKIEALLFWNARPMSKKNIIELLEISEEDFGAGIAELKRSKSDKGVLVVENDNKYMLATSPECSSPILKSQKTVAMSELSPASLETVVIILYRGPVRKFEIDHIRGVNSSYSLRLLGARGLIKKRKTATGATYYRPTQELLGFLGVEKQSDLPDYEKIKNDLDVVLGVAKSPHEESGTTSTDTSSDNDAQNDL